MTDTYIRVLLIEDNPGDARFIEELLSDRISFQIEVTERLSDGLEALSTGRFDVVLLHLSLPDSSGLDTLTKAHSQAHQVPIIIMTGLGDEKLAVKAMRKGAQDYLVKGEIDENVLPRAIRYAIERKGAEEGLRKSEEKYRRIVETAQEGIWIINAEGKTIYVNQQLAEMFGYTAKEMLGRSAFDFIDDSNREEAKRRIEQRKRGMKDQYDFEFKRRDGSVLWARVSGNPMFDDDGQFIGNFSMISDISDRRRAEEMLRESEERYRTLIQNVPIAVYRTARGPKGRFLMANPTFLKMFALESDEELKEITVADVYMSPKARKAFSDDLLAKGSVTEVELPLRKKDGTPFWGSVTARVVYDESRKSAYFDCTILDVTERKWAQEALRESKEQLKTITDSIQTGIVLIDAETHIIVDANPAAVKIIGAPKEQIIGHVCHKYFCLAEKGKCPITDLGQEMDNSERILLKANGEEVPILKTVTPILLSGRECLLHSFVDLTGQKQLEAQLSQAQKVEAIGTLAGGIAHNFNNLLMGVMGNTSLMLFEIDSAHPDYERLKNIENSVESGSRLTRQLLGYAREGRYEIKPISLNELVRETSDTFATTKKVIRVHQELAQDLFGINADQGQIEQILLNLYVNASDAMPAGGDLFLKTANVTHKDMTGKLYKAKPGNYVLLTVRDTGMGMDKRTQERIFDPFFTTKAMGRGTGLGLASVYGTVKAHAGYIDVESKKGHGSTFEIYLPAASKKELIKVRELPETILKCKETILLVDDEDMVLHAGEGMLKAMGYKVLLARGGKEAIELYKKNKDRIDIVLLDMIMPDMGGGETYDRMKEINPHIKVLLLSGYSIDGQAEQILERGCNGFMQKPFNMRKLSQELRKILDKK